MNYETLSRVANLLLSPVGETDVLKIHKFVERWFPTAAGSKVKSLCFDADYAYDDEGNHNFYVTACNANGVSEYGEKNMTLLDVDGNEHELDLGEVQEVEFGSYYSTKEGKYVKTIIKTYDKFDLFYDALRDHDEVFARLLGVPSCIHENYDGSNSVKLPGEIIYNLDLSYSAEDYEKLRDLKNYKLLYMNKDLDTGVIYEPRP